ncbi:MAG: M1 family aminopeptidase [Acidobacteriota bacterium]
MKVSILSFRALGVLFALFALSPLSVLAQNQTSSDAELKLDVEHYEIKAELEPENSYLKGEAKVGFKVLEDIAALPFELNNRLTIIDILDEQGVRYSSSFDDFDSSRLNIRGDGLFRAGSEMTLTFSFQGTLEPEEYAFLDTPGTEKVVISPEGALLLSEGQWFPVHSLLLDAATTSVEITVPLGFTVVAPGVLQPIRTVAVSEVFTWTSDQPVTGVPVVVARYFRQNFDEQPVPLTFFVTEEYDQDLKPLAEEIGSILQFFRDQYGEFPMARLNLVQVAQVNLPSTGCAGLVLLEPNLLNLRSTGTMELAKRLAQQWWGYSVRLSRPHDAWIQDGFATYAALRYLEEKKPDEFPTELARQSVQALKYQEQAPVARGLRLIPGSAQYDSIVGSKGAWVLYMLRQLVGDEKFGPVLKHWYAQNANQAANTSSFSDFVQVQTGTDYDWFFVQWLEGVGVPEFRLEYTVFKLQAGGFKIRGQITQSLELFKMPMEVSIETKGKPENKELMVNGKTTSFTFDTETMPVRLNLDPNGKILRDSEKMRVAVHLALGQEYQEQGDFVSAIREFEKAGQMDPRSSLADYRLGEVYFLQHSYNSAANSFRDALNGDLKPEWVETWTHIHLGKIYDILGQRPRAMAEYQKAINSKVDHNGAQSEAEKYLKEPYSKPSSVLVN